MCALLMLRRNPTDELLMVPKILAFFTLRVLVRNPAVRQLQRGIFGSPSLRPCLGKNKNIEIDIKTALIGRAGLKRNIIGFHVMKPIRKRHHIS